MKITQIALLIPILISTVAYGQENAGKIWHGEINYTYKKDVNFKGGRKPGFQGEANGGGQENRRATLKIEACVSGDSFARATGVSYEGRLACFSHWQREHETCLDERSRPVRKATPGDSASYEETKRFSTVTGGIPGHDLLGITVLPRGMYILTAPNYAIHYRVDGQHRNFAKKACSGNTKTNQSTMTSFPDGKHQLEIIFSDTPPLRSTLGKSFLTLIPGIRYEGTAEGDLISGSTILQSEHTFQSPCSEDIRNVGVEITEKKFDEEIEAKWEFTAKSICDAVVDQLRVDEAYFQAYANKELLDFAIRKRLNTEQYNKLVEDTAIQNRRKAPGGGGSERDWRPGDDLVTGNDCQTPGEEKYRNRARQECTPEVIVDSVMAHEEMHQIQCTEEHQKFILGNTDPRAYRDNEKEAYCAGMQVLLDFLDDECSFNTQPYRNLCSKK